MLKKVRIWKSKIQAGVILMGLWGAITAHGADRPKYGPKTTPLRQDHAYVQKNAAPDFWALIPYAQAQRDGRSCSLAVFATTINSLRARRPMTADDKFVGQGELLDQVDHAGWNRMFKQKGKTASLQEFAQIAEKALQLYGIKGKKVEWRHVDKADDKAIAEIREMLVKNEKSADDLILVNALQSELTADPEGAVGHVLNVGAYDAARDRVLLIDPDREYYEPYWVDLKMLVQGMNTRDSDSGKNRGYIWIR